MGQLGPPKPHFLSLDKKTISPIFLFRLGYPHAKFQNNLVIFDWSRIFPKIGQLGPPKPPFFSLDQKTYFTNIFYLG